MIGYNNTNSASSSCATTFSRLTRGFYKYLNRQTDRRNYNLGDTGSGSGNSSTTLASTIQFYRMFSFTLFVLLLFTFIYAHRTAAAYETLLATQPGTGDVTQREVEIASQTQTQFAQSEVQRKELSADLEQSKQVAQELQTSLTNLLDTHGILPTEPSSQQQHTSLSSLTTLLQRITTSSTLLQQELAKKLFQLQAVQLEKTKLQESLKVCQEKVNSTRSKDDAGVDAHPPVVPVSAVQLDSTPSEAIANFGVAANQGIDSPQTTPISPLTTDDNTESEEAESDPIESEQHQQQPPSTEHFVRHLPLHQQSPSLLPEPDLTPAAPFPTAYLRGGYYDTLSSNSPDIQTDQRRTSVRDEFLHAWKGYRENAWGYDELHPLSHEGRNSQYNMALTLIDSMDTMIIMGLKEEYTEARDYIAQYLTFTQQEDINLFETSIRVLGGLLSTYALTEDQVFLTKAIECANGLLVAFDTPTGIPHGTVGFASKTANNPAWSGSASTMSEVGSIQLEWQYLSRLTGDALYSEKVDLIMEKLDEHKAALYPQFLSTQSGAFTNEVYTFGARVDSIYEYFVKQAVANRDEESKEHTELVKEMYLRSMRGMDHDLIKTAHSHDYPSTHKKLVYIAEKHGASIHGKMDHLCCFIPGMLALGVHHNIVTDPKERERHMFIATEMMETCIEMYRMTSTGLAPEITQFSLDTDPNSNDPGMHVDAHAQHNILRPEAVESLMLMYRFTNNTYYRDEGWKIFEAFRRYCKLDKNGYAGLNDVRVNDRPSSLAQPWGNHKDKMESFFLSETMKYFYLLFSPHSLISLDEFVFNTEAHPMPIVKEGRKWTEVEGGEGRRPMKKQPSLQQHTQQEQQQQHHSQQHTPQITITPKSKLTKQKKFKKGGAKKKKGRHGRGLLMNDGVEGGGQIVHDDGGEVEHTEGDEEVEGDEEYEEEEESDTTSSPEYTPSSPAPPLDPTADQMSPELIAHLEAARLHAWKMLEEKHNRQIEEMRQKQIEGMQRHPQQQQHVETLPTQPSSSTPSSVPNTAEATATSLPSSDAALEAEVTQLMDAVKSREAEAHESK